MLGGGTGGNGIIGGKLGTALVYGFLPFKHTGLRRAGKWVNSPKRPTKSIEVILIRKMLHI